MKTSFWSVLNKGFTAPVRDPLWGHIYLTPELEAITQSAAFVRLHRIFQLGPVYRVYPGATHTRAGHSIGVFYLARRLLQNLVERGASEWLSPTGIRSFLAAALLHDIGHFPYTHSLKELPLLSHETLSATLIQAEPLRELVAASGADPLMTAAIVDTELAIDTNEEVLFYRKLLSGTLDPDKLDYLNRDARYAGVPYGAQDVDFILSRLYPHRERGVDIDSRGIPSVESVLFSKYLMYRTVYRHRSVRSATAMIKKALIAGLDQRILAGEELYGLDDQGLFVLLASRAAQLPLLSLAEAVRNGRLYKTAAEFPYHELEHGGLLDIGKRSHYEQALAQELSIPPEALIIDVPESVSFETGLYVNDELCPFSESSGIFKGETVDAFKKTLRIVRVFVDPRYQVGADDPQIRSTILHIIKK